MWGRGLERTFVDDRARLDPYDPATGRHLGQREHIGETDPAVIKVLLKVSDKGATTGSSAAAAAAAGRFRTTPRASGDDASTTRHSL
jgi:hypothetical protein